MDFTNPAFQAPKRSSSLSNDTIDHGNLVMSCRFGWSASSEGTQSNTPSPYVAATLPNPPISSTNKRFLNCHGRLYHQLICGHRIRTDIVDPCGSNCVEPFEGKEDTPFYCQECFDSEASRIWAQREAQHNALYPPRSEMTKEQFSVWADEHRQLEWNFRDERDKYVLQMKATLRPSNVCSVNEMSDADREFASQLDSLVLSMCTSNSSIDSQPASLDHRRSLPTDASEQLHWHLNSLALEERGSCGVEYASKPGCTAPADQALFSPRAPQQGP